MKHPASILLAGLLPFSALAADEEIEPPFSPETIAQLADKGFTPLLDGNSLEGWEVRGGKADFSIKDGVVTGRGNHVKGNSFLCSEKRYRDFIFVFQMKFEHMKGNSGCMFRANLRNGNKVFGYQCEHDNHSNRSWTAGIYDEARRGWLSPTKDERGPAGQAYRQAFTEQGIRLFKKDDWNTIVIKCRGNRIQTWLNGELRVDFTDRNRADVTLEGFLGLQVHGAQVCDVQWRKLFIKELE